MKLFFLTIALLSAQNSFAIDCDHYFATGTSAYNKAVSENQNGIDLFNDALASYNAQEYSMACTEFSNSGIQFRGSEYSYNACRSAFLAATSVCTGENITIADNNRQLCRGRQQTALENGDLARENAKIVCNQNKSRIVEELKIQK